MTSGIGPASALKARETLTGKQARRFSVSRRRREVWRACTLKEALRGIFEHGLTVRDVTGLIDRFISRVAGPARSGNPQAPSRDPRAVDLGINNARAGTSMPRGVF